MCYTLGMAAVPVPKIDPDGHSPSRGASKRRKRRAPEEALFRPVVKPDGDVVVEKIPLTLDVLLHPQEDDQVSQSRPHHKKLNPLADTLERFLERQPGVGVFSELMILWEQLGGRDVAPDIYVVKGVRDRNAIDGSFDPVVEKANPCLVIEVVSTSSRAMVRKDEEKNPELFAAMGVEDLVLLYPPRPVTEQRLRLDARRLTAPGRYRANRPDPEGWIHLHSVGLRIQVAEDREQLQIEDVKTGERLLTSVEEEAARRAAEKRADQAEQRAEREAEARRQEAEARRQEAEARRQAEERAEQEAESRHRAEGRVEQALRTNVEDLCRLLGIEWSSERSALVAGMGAAQLEALRADLLSQKRWP